MVRLVFRPYTQLRRSICTSESLRSSIRVSPDFEFSPCFPGAQRTMRIQQNVYGNLYSQAVTHPSTNRSPYMLDSLVRVSRREMRTATERCSLYESSHVPVGRGARTPGAASRTDNFTQGLRSEPNGSCRKLRRKCTQEPSQTESAVIADRTHPDRPTPRLSSQQRLRELLRLPSHSFTYS